ncbi:hypothetical protein D9M68_699280 [compost metagenome]
MKQELIPRVQNFMFFQIKTVFFLQLSPILLYLKVCMEEPGILTCAFFLQKEMGLS